MDYNLHHKRFKKDMRAYNKSINDANKYNMKRITGKLNIFEGSSKSARRFSEDEEMVELDRTIPGTDLVVLKKDKLYAIGDADGNPLTDFDYIFIEGVFGDKEKQITCITEYGDMKIFDVEEKMIKESVSIHECDGGIGVGTVAVSDGGTGCADSSSDTNTSDSKHEIDYDDVKDGLILPFISRYRIKDMRSGKLLHKGIKRPKKRRYSKYPY